jgi:hypothetical protein
MTSEIAHIHKLIDDNEIAIAYCENRMNEEKDTGILKQIIEQLKERRERLKSRLVKKAVQDIF